MKIILGSDHAGFSLKEELKASLVGEGHEVIDVGAHDTSPSDYPDFARMLAEALIAGRGEKGLLVCGSGVGASVAANKVPGVRAAICHDTYSAHQGVEHDDMNVLVLGARVVGIELAKELVRRFLEATFSGAARHARRLKKVVAIEEDARRGVFDAVRARET